MRMAVKRVKLIGSSIDRRLTGKCSVFFQRKFETKPEGVQMIVEIPEVKANMQFY